MEADGSETAAQRWCRRKSQDTADPRDRAAARPEGPRRPRDLRHPGRFRAAVLQGDRGKRDPSVLHAQPRARRRVRSRCRGPLSCRPGGRRRHLRGGRVQSGQCRRRCLCRALAGRGHRGRSGGGRAHQRLCGPPPGPLDRHPDGGLPRNHLRRRADQSDTAPAETARVAQRASVRFRSISNCRGTIATERGGPGAAAAADPEAPECADDWSRAGRRRRRAMVDVEIRRYGANSASALAQAGLRGDHVHGRGLLEDAPDVAADLFAPPAIRRSPPRMPMRCCCSA